MARIKYLSWCNVKKCFVVDHRSVACCPAKQPNFKAQYNRLFFISLYLVKQKNNKQAVKIGTTKHKGDCDVAMLIV